QSLRERLSKLVLDAAKADGADPQVRFSDTYASARGLLPPTAQRVAADLFAIACQELGIPADDEVKPANRTGLWEATVVVGGRAE
ncbi:MAG: hypothetical protein M3220_07450, partial [Chloroflexota bacterium]|nr:hypothetical protein [Chloroflexota bacterium]